MTQPKPPVFFHFTDVRFYFPKRNQTKEYVAQLISSEGLALDEINYIFCSDTYLLALNKQFLNHDTFTDIITFPYNAASEPIHSDVYISIDRVRENATKFKVSFSKELHRVLFHGALHLCGYKDKTLPQEKAMRSKEDFYLNQFLVPRETSN